MGKDAPGRRVTSTATHESVGSSAQAPTFATGSICFPKLLDYDETDASSGRAYADKTRRQTSVHLALPKTRC